MSGEKNTPELLLTKRLNYKLHTLYMQNIQTSPGSVVRQEHLSHQNEKPDWPAYKI